MRSFVRLGSMVFIFERFMFGHDLLNFKQKENTVSAISIVYDCSGGIELADSLETCSGRQNNYITYNGIRNAASTY